MQHRRCASSSFQIAVLIYRFKFAATPARARRAISWPTTKPTTTRARTYGVDDVHAAGLYRLENNSIKDKVVAGIFISSLKRFLRSKKLKPTHNKNPDKMKSLFILFAIVAVVAAFPEPDRERRGLLGAPAVALARPALAPAVAIAPAPIAIAPAPALVAAPALGAAPWGLKGW
ncbi:hypothetical protein WN51_06048 [Melipona quadrifasciata]|uniref:Uncharacterized protein n=1 Tax=Melipona quadrifasciata TaxID=166423 RepID=A0A0N0BBW7_9HYME|nr:hypothetical protein WN51_06048 [Melipona quadrifasciata]